MAKGAGESAEKIVKDIRRRTRRRIEAQPQQPAAKRGAGRTNTSDCCHVAVRRLAGALGDRQ